MLFDVFFNAAFKLFHFGSSVHFYVYPLPYLMLTLVPYIKILGGVLYLIGAKKMAFRVYRGIILIPVLLGAVSSHIVFGWLTLWGGVSEAFYLTMPSVVISSLTIWISYQPINNFIKSGFRVID